MSAIRRLNSLSRTLIALCATVGAVVMAVFMPVTAAAQVEYPPGAVSLTITPSTVAPGGTVTVTAAGCEVGVDLTVSVDGTSISTTAVCTAGASAGFRRVEVAAGNTASASFAAPTAAGTYTVRAVETGGQGRSATGTLTVAAAAATTAPGGTLPSTGSETWPVAAVAATVLLLGFGVVLIARRRHGLPA